MAFYCNGKKGICTDMHTSQFCSRDCRFGDGTGGHHVETNGDRIRSMSDEELAKFIPDWSYTNACKLSEEAYVDCNNECEKCVADWLKQEADHDTD